MIDPNHAYSCHECGKAVYRARIKVYCRGCHNGRAHTGPRRWLMIGLSSLVSSVLALAAEAGWRATRGSSLLELSPTVEVARSVWTAAYPRIVQHHGRYADRGAD